MMITIIRDDEDKQMNEKEPDFSSNCSNITANHKFNTAGHGGTANTQTSGRTDTQPDRHAFHYNPILQITIKQQDRQTAGGPAGRTKPHH